MKSKQKTSFSIAIIKFQHNVQGTITKYIPTNFRFDSLHAMLAPKNIFQRCSYVELRSVSFSYVLFIFQKSEAKFLICLSCARHAIRLL